MTTKYISGQIPFISLSVVTLGYLNYYLYYFYYGIPIYNYLDTTEIIFAFSSLIPSLSLGVVMFVLMSISHHVTRKDSLERMERYLEKMKEEDLIQKPHKEPKSIIRTVFTFIPLKYHELAKDILVFVMSVLMFIIGVMLYYLLFMLVPSYVFSRILLLSHASELVFDMSFVLITLIIYSFTPRDSSRLKLMMGYLSVFIVFIVLRTHAAYNAIIGDIPKYYMALELKDGTIIFSDSSRQYIGSTRGYHFFHNDTDENIIIPDSEVAKSTLKELRDGV